MLTPCVSFHAGNPTPLYMACIDLTAGRLNVPLRGMAIFVVYIRCRQRKLAGEKKNKYRKQSAVVAQSTPKTRSGKRRFTRFM